jgi:hypothetical protein
MIIEYDIAKKTIVSSSIPRKTGKCGSVVITSGKLYAACDVRGIAAYKDKFKGYENAPEQFAVFRVNRTTGATERVYTPADGLKNTGEYRLFAAPDAALWISTANGVGRLDLKTEKITFFDRALDMPGTETAVGDILFDGDYIWASILTTGESNGGISLYDKKSGVWKGFSSDNLQDRTTSKVGLEGVKLITGGIQIAFRDGRVNQTERLVEKQYNYANHTWTKISDMPTTGDGGIPTYEYMSTAYPQRPVYTLSGRDGLTQFRYPVTGQTFLTNGRRAYILSAEISGKRYLLTSASVDVIDDRSPFNRILVPLGEGLALDKSLPDPAQYRQFVEFAIDPRSLLAIAADPACGPTGCTDRQKAWLINLKTGKLLGTYTSTEGLPTGKLLTKLTIVKSAAGIDVYNKLGLKLFTINPSNYTLSPLVSPSPFR